MVRMPDSRIPTTLCCQLRRGRDIKVVQNDIFMDSLNDHFQSCVIDPNSFGNLSIDCTL